MLTSGEIREVTFEKTRKGYNEEDVIAFLDEIATQVECLENEKADLSKKVYVLAEKVAEYRKDEDNLRTALINAQRLGEQVIGEAKQKAEAILKDANIKAEQIVEAAEIATDDEKLQFEKIQAEVAEFKNNVLSLYKKHIESLSTLPEPANDNVSETVNVESQDDFIDNSQADTQEPDIKFDNLVESNSLF